MQKLIVMRVIDLTNGEPGRSIAISRAELSRRISVKRRTLFRNIRPLIEQGLLQDGITLGLGQVVHA